MDVEAHGWMIPRQKALSEQQLALEETVGTARLASLRSISAEELQTLSRHPLSSGEVFAYGPIVGGPVMHRPAKTLLSEGAVRRVAILGGWNRDEQDLRPGLSAEAFRSSVQNRFGDKSEEVMRLYGIDEHRTPSQADALLRSETWDVVRSVRNWLEGAQEGGVAAMWRYRFDHAPPADRFHPEGDAAYHAAEIPYVFGNLSKLRGFPWSADDKQISNLMQAYWTNFAKRGDPNGEGLPLWRKYRPKSQFAVLYFEAFSSKLEPDKSRKRMMWLEDEANEDGTSY